MQSSNSLQKESSPYLLQHAQNPVHWQAWSENLFQQAKDQNKLVLISVGYSTCHWCHVMEEESFENQEVADLMNENFICVKVDREEHPDVDKVYMNAVQIMTNRGGWPLNCITLPDGRPVYGGTYFPKDQWIHILKSITHMKQNEYAKMEEYAQQLQDGLSQTRPFVEIDKETSLDFKSIIDETVLKWKERLDYEFGGLNRAPKFPLPNNIDFQLYYSVYRADKSLDTYLHTTLTQMALGGIYDHVEGGFSRYSVDHEWKVPHFEKMLYDNAQLLTTYSTAYQINPLPVYKTVVKKTFDFIHKRHLAQNGGYYAAYDADTEGVEGKFYVWKIEELQNILGNQWDEASFIFDFSPAAHWEDGNYILRRNTHFEYIQEVLNCSLEEIETKAESISQLLNKSREKRIYPGLDHKQLTSWNALLLKGFTTIYRVFSEPRYKTSAEELYHWISKNIVPSTGVYRTVTNDIAKLEGTLEDYATLMDAFLEFGVLFKNDDAISQVQKWITKIEAEFKDEHSSLFFFTPKESNLFYREIDVSDNVIPSANSIIANVYYKIGILLDEPKYVEQSKKMLAQVINDIPHYGSAYSNWAILALHFGFELKKIKINTSLAENSKIEASYLPNVIVTLDNQQKETLLCTINSCSTINLEQEGWIEKCRY